MATSKTNLPQKVQKKLIEHCKGILEQNKKHNDLRNKMTDIDIAYARYKAGETDGTEECGDLFDKDRIVVPIVVAQVDSYVSYLSDVFLSGSPIFPIVSTPAKRKDAERMETLIDDHAMLGGYARQILRFLRDGVKYNIAALEADWDVLENFEVSSEYLSTAQGGKVSTKERSLTKLRALDMYNTVWDTTVSPGDVAAEGDFAGYIEKLTFTKFKRLMRRLQSQQIAYNVSDTINFSSIPEGTSYYNRPTISKYIGDNKSGWDAWFGSMAPGSADSSKGMVELATLYIRICPRDFGITAPMPDKLQIWQIRILNGATLVSARRIVSAYERLPILFGQPLEDGMDYQTQSVAEMQIPIQEAATTLFGIRFAAARRSVSDRAIYDPDIISPEDVNSRAAAPKIPARINKMQPGTSLSAAYHPIPFDMRGTESALGDISSLVGFSQQLSGINNPRQGQFQKGNKSVQEWQDTMGSSDSRLRLAALCLEHQVFVWLKFILLLNIYQFGEDTVVVSQKTGEIINIDINTLRKEVLSFRVADGYNPKAKLASIDMLTTGLTLIKDTPALQQAYGAMLPSIFAHLMQLGGVRGLEEYAPDNQAQAGAAPNAAALPGMVPGQAETVPLNQPQPLQDPGVQP